MTEDRMALVELLQKSGDRARSASSPVTLDPDAKAEN